MEIGKIYITKGNKYVKVICTDRPDSRDYPIIALVSDNSTFIPNFLASYSTKGKCFSRDADIDIDILSDLKVDDKVLVKSNPEDPWKRRYFSGFSLNGEPMTFDHGATSWTAKEDKTANEMVWEFCNGATSWTAKEDKTANETAWKFCIRA